MYEPPHRAEVERLTIEVQRLSAELHRRQRDGDAMAHVIIESGVVPGVDYPCRCDECRDSAKRMAAVGYLDHVADRWWEAAEPTTAAM